MISFLLISNNFEYVVVKTEFNSLIGIQIWKKAKGKVRKEDWGRYEEDIKGISE